METPTTLTFRNIGQVFPTYKMPHRAAFTLAELLITLGIIGVVAAMTLPALINNSRNKEFEAALKKNYSVIQQAFDMYQAQNGNRLIPENYLGNNINKLKLEIMPYFNVIRDCGVGFTNDPYDPECGAVNSGNIDSIQSAYKTFHNVTLTSLGLFDDGQFIILDGSTIFIENRNDSSNVYITVDVNGSGKRPNRWGFDLFTFQLMKEGNILPMGAPETDYTDENIYCSKSSSNSFNGVACTYKALTDKNYWKNLP